MPFGDFHCLLSIQQCLLVVSIAFWMFTNAFWWLSLPFGCLAMPFGVFHCFLDISHCLLNTPVAFRYLPMHFGVFHCTLGTQNIKTRKIFGSQIKLKLLYFSKYISNFPETSKNNVFEKSTQNFDITGGTKTLFRTMLKGSFAQLREQNLPRSGHFLDVPGNCVHADVAESWTLEGLSI